MAAHASIAPSALDRIFLCPGSVKLSEGKPEKSSKYADEGSLAHEVAALILREDGTREAVQAGHHVFEHGEPDAKMLDHVDGYVAAMREIIALDPHCVFGVEQKVQATAEVWGTADFWAYLPMFHTVICRDLKYGAGEFVEVKKNKQQLAYLLGVVKYLLAIDTLSEDGLDMLSVEIGVYQPRNLGETGKAHRTQILGYADLAEFENQLFEVEARVAAGTEFASGKCRYCKAALECPLNNESMQALDFASPSGATKLPEVTNDQLAYWLVCESRLRRFMAEVRSTAVTRAELGETIPGYTMEERFSNRTWIDPLAALKTLVPLTPANDANFAPMLFEAPVLKSPAQMEKLGSQFKTAVKTLTTRTSLGYSLKPTDEKDEDE